jgi:arylsulfatase
LWLAAAVAAGALFGWLATTGRLPLRAAFRPKAEEKSAGTSIPHADPPFRGKAGMTYKDSTPDYPPAVTAPKGAPNVLIILLDDVGFGQAGTFGGPVPTPTLDRIARGGLRYNRFHTAALCSPTRAALLTGRNPHSCGTGVVIEAGTGYPGYTGILPRSTATVATILQQNGYATAMFGKWHNTPEREISPAGPFDRWPTGLGFNYFYGFNQGETNQFYPVLYRNTTPVEAPKTPEQGYHFTTDMTDETIAWLRNVRAASPHRPWFAYYSTGAAHAPLQAPQAWRDRFKGQFDHGWDRERERTFARQKKLGVIPPDAKLTPRPREIPAWADQPADARRVYARLMEAFAGFLAHTDHEIGRLIDAVEQAGDLDNTLIFFMVGDNGPSPEGGLEGTFNEVAGLMGFHLGLASSLARIDEIGGPHSEPHYPVGWAWAGAAPFQWTKQVASHFGGTRNPLVIHWPRRIKAKGGLRTQFHHVIDVVPTILEATGVPAPTHVNGIRQKPIEGVSMVYTFGEGGAREKGRRTTQYFEMFGNRGVYHDGWMACTRHSLPWVTTGRTGDFDKDTWELYHVDRDFSQADNLAAKRPERLKELQELFVKEAKKYNVLPLDDRAAERFDPALRGGGKPPTSWTYTGVVRLPEPIGPQLLPRAHTITAELVVPKGGASGVIAAAGGQSAGWSVYALDGRLTYAYNFFDVERTVIKGKTKLPEGKATVKVEYRPAGPGKGGTVRLLVNGAAVGEGRVKRVSFRHGIEPFEVGRDSITPVSLEYAGRGAFPFNGRVERIRFDLTPPR